MQYVAQTGKYAAYVVHYASNLDDPNCPTQIQERDSDFGNFFHGVGDPSRVSGENHPERHMASSHVRPNDGRAWRVGDGVTDWRKKAKNGVFGPKFLKQRD